MSPEAVTIVGSYLSPYIRKVLVCLALKGIDYVIDPIVPVVGSEEFSRSSPLRSVPIFIDRSVALAESTVICEYLQERYPEPALYPATPQMRARARWLEEYADTRLGEVFIWRLFNERVVKRVVWGEEADQAMVTTALEIQAPQVLDYLEREFSAARPYLYGTMGIADITVASFMRNAGFAGYAIDAERWPAMHSMVRHALQHPAFAALDTFERVSLATPLPQLREALAAAGAPVSDKSYASDLPQHSAIAH